MALEGMRDRFERLAPRERKLVLLLGATFVFCVVAWVVMTVRGGLDKVDKGNRAKRSALIALEQYRASAQSHAAGANVEIPKVAIGLDSYVDAILKEIKVASPAYPTPKEALKGAYKEVSFKVTLRDLTIYQLKDLLEKIESRSAVVVVSQLHVKKSFRDPEKLDADLTVATYYQPSTEDKGKPAADKPAGKEPG